MILTKQIFQQFTINGALTKEQVQYLGGKYPLQKGWVKSLIGRELFDFMLPKLMEMKKEKDGSFNKKRAKLEQDVRLLGGSVIWDAN